MGVSIGLPTQTGKAFSLSLMLYFVVWTLEQAALALQSLRGFKEAVFFYLRPQSFGMSLGSRGNIH